MGLSLRVLESSTPVDPVIFYLGRLCIEDFNEILVLCANGYGYGASKLIRGMFERVLTGLYLHLHPDQAEDFLDFYWISQRKEINNLKSAFGEMAIDATTAKLSRKNTRSSPNGLKLLRATIAKRSESITRGVSLTSLRWLRTFRLKVKWPCKGLCSKLISARDGTLTLR